jgi:DNA-binding NarL/FixJ family response regulator
MLRSGLRHALQERTRVTIVGEASTGDAAIKLALDTAPDVVVMDLHLPDMSGIVVTRQILQKLPRAKVIMFSGDANAEQVDESLQAGAVAYLWKQGGGDEFLRAFETVMEGKLYLSPEINALVLENYRKGLSKEPEPPRQVLLEREKILLRAIADGRRNKEIADQFNLSPKSIEAYRARLMRKLGCTSTAEMIRFAIRERIIAP